MNPSDIDNIRGASDEQLFKWAANPVGTQHGDLARAELQMRTGRAIAESIKHLEGVAASTEKSGKRMEWATWIILLATVVQLVLAGWSAVHGK